ncbi:MAG TPA: phage tail protein [Planctomycetota bacterium]|jgi:phage tail-like protein|nr:phage tail protein [Planctomycetota bacterium]
MQSVPYFGNFNFLVEIEDLAAGGSSVVGGFSLVSGISTQSEVVEHRVGNSNTVMKIPGKTRYGNIVLQKGCTTSSELYQWRRRIENGEDDRRSGSIVLLDGGMREKARWNFYEAWPCRYEAPELDAADNAVSIETLELCVERVERMESAATGGTANRP